MKLKEKIVYMEFDDEWKIRVTELEKIAKSLSKFER